MDNCVILRKTSREVVRGVKARQLIENLQPAKPVQEASHDMRFDVDCRVEVWVTWDELAYRDDVRRVLASGAPADVLLNALQTVALTVAREKVEAASRDGIEITCDINPQDVNIDRIPWSEIIQNAPRNYASEE